MKAQSPATTVIKGSLSCPEVTRPRAKPSPSLAEETDRFRSTEANPSLIESFESNSTHVYIDKNGRCVFHDDFRILTKVLQKCYQKGVDNIIKRRHKKESRRDMESATFKTVKAIVDIAV